MYINIFFGIKDQSVYLQLSLNISNIFDFLFLQFSLLILILLNRFSHCKFNVYAVFLPIWIVQLMLESSSLHAICDLPIPNVFDFRNSCKLGLLYNLVNTRSLFVRIGQK